MILNIINLQYESENTSIINGINLSIKGGECISIIGASGSGKSTLLKLCADLLPLTKGTIEFKGKDYKEYNPILLRRKISYCVQLPYLFGATVYDNLTFPFLIRKEPINKERIFELLKRFNLEEGILQKEVNSLSGGEKQRVALARSLMYVPEILLLDEATASLDPESSLLVEKYIKELNDGGVTVLWITHNLEQSKGIFTKRITIDGGRIAKEELL